MKLQRWKKRIPKHTFLGDPTTTGSRNSYKDLLKVKPLATTPSSTLWPVHRIPGELETRVNY